MHCFRIYLHSNLLLKIGMSELYETGPPNWGSLVLILQPSCLALICAYAAFSLSKHRIPLSNHPSRFH